MRLKEKNRGYGLIHEFMPFFYFFYFELRYCFNRGGAKKHQETIQKKDYKYRH